MSIISYLTDFDGILKYHTSELSNLSNKAKSVCLLLNEPIKSKDSKYCQIVCFLQWLFLDLNRRIFMENQCSIIVDGYCENFKVTAYAHSRCFFQNFKANENWINRNSKLWLQYEEKSRKYQSRTSQFMIATSQYPKIKLDANNKVNIEIMERHLLLLRAHLESIKCSSNKNSGSVKAMKDIAKTASNLTIYASDNDTLNTRECQDGGGIEGSSILDVSLTTTASTCSVTTVALATVYPPNSYNEQLVLDENTISEQQQQHQGEEVASGFPEQTAEGDREESQQDSEINPKREGLSSFPSSASSLCKFFGVHTKEIFSGAYLWRKCGNEYFSKRRFFWLDPSTLSLKWSKTADGVDKAVSGIKYFLLKRSRRSANRTNTTATTPIDTYDDKNAIHFSDFKSHRNLNRNNKENEEGFSGSMLVYGQLQGVVKDYCFDSTGFTLWTENETKMHIHISAAHLPCWQRAILTLLQ